MKPKILVADDSLTIQKVIKITLANEDYDLVECFDDKNLLEMISSEQPTITLLDFNLSESKVGYDLVNEIQKISNSKVLMMYGTFDTVDETLLNELNITEHLIKPFDGNKFIASCRRLTQDSDQITDELDEDQTQAIELEEFPEDELASTEQVSTSLFDDDDDDDQWVVNQPEVIDDSVASAEEVISVAEMNQLEAGMQDWGIDIPGVIGQTAQKASVELPPVIETVSESNNIEAMPEVIEEDEDVVLPVSEDLEYPDMISNDSESELIELSAELIPLDELKEDVEEVELVGNDAEPAQGEGTTTDEEIRKLEEQIADEIDQEDDGEDEDDFWAADEFVESEPNSEESEQEVELELIDEPTDEDFEINIDEVRESFTSLAADDDEPSETLQEPRSIISEEQLSELELRIKEMMTPMIEQMVKDHIQESIDKVAWEVIPDLAENLIKKELKTISQSILKSE